MFPGVQALRAIAATMIVLLHVGHEAGTFAGVPGRMPVTWMDGLQLDAGVDLFFVISGLVMVWSQRRRFGDPGAVWPFARRRIWRIVPLYWLLTLASFAAGHAMPGAMSFGAASVGDLLRSLLFFPYVQPDGLIQPLLRLGWTLNYEIFFYALFALCLPFRRGRLAVLALLVVLVALGQAGLSLPVPLVFWTSPILVQFGLGVILGMLVVRDEPRGWALGAAAACALCVAAAVTPGHLAEVVLRGVLAASIVALSVQIPRMPAWALLLGDASYALYLVHPFPMRGLRLAMQRVWGDGVSIPLYAALAIGLSFGLALLLHLVIERPLLRGGKPRVREAVG